MMRIAVTGGNGDLGRNLVPHLIEQGHEVVSIDLALPTTPKPPPARSPDCLIANTTNFDELLGAIEGCEAIIHLAAHRSPKEQPYPLVYAENTVSSYNVLYAALTLGLKRVCLASSVNAIGGAFSQAPRYDYFPLDEQHPAYAEDSYSLSKWVLEQQGDAFARLDQDMSIASLRFHWLVEKRERAVERTPKYGAGAVRHLWAYTLLSAASRACLLSLTADFTGHEAFYIVAPQTAMSTPSLDLAREHYPQTPLRQDLPGNAAFFNCHKAERLLGWKHEV